MNDSMNHALIKLRQRDLPFMLFWAVGVHLGFGLALLSNKHVPSLSVLLGLHVWGDLLGATIFGLILIMFGLLALTGLLFEGQLSRKQVLAFLAPQYCVIFSGFCVATYILEQGSFHGRPFDFWVGFAGLWSGMVAAMLHTWAVLNRYVWGTNGA